MLKHTYMTMSACDLLKVAVPYMLWQLCLCISHTCDKMAMHQASFTILVVHMFYSKCECSSQFVVVPVASGSHCMLSLAAQCIVIGPVCGFVCVCGSVTMVT